MLSLSFSRPPSPHTHRVLFHLPTGPPLGKTSANLSACMFSGLQFERQTRSWREQGWLHTENPDEQHLLREPGGDFTGPRAHASPRQGVRRAQVNRAPKPEKSLE